MSANEIGREVAELLFRAGAIHVSREQPFILAAGWASPVYVDVRLLLGDPDLRQAVSDLAARYAATTFPPGSFDAIAGAETAGIPFAAWLADRLALKLRYVRKRPLGIGRNAQVEGGSVEGLRVLLMDDLTTDGGSKLNFARGLRAAGAEVEHVLTIFYHDAFPGAGERLREAGLTLHALANWADVLRAEVGRALAPEDRSEIERFLADPVAWSTRHGGRARLAPRN
ncbi:Orotate phosphoribosyltransferase [Bosea sp. 62]|uniref:orotate phosphoribosyltransferase n=1 Tax=unclassified Bosea (in: a-proteobacteria) TaxID=2653178 RepID=UPI001254E69E|nr:MULTISPECIES: orotate phosphoribosyltransferase [unclassified Bosea (in: a-proteobacteria)]CAD5249081.1 Orotate phosphoribosyltransferase [Bosea sp. 46]CAD5250119.1 Orotate phosphoribosyltransferase [Bosea sp. 21B]CAD5265639.1 Orotate phosphoribosyltransferase [Bosea sp. 7B]VVT44565.1 Orotate phosphoribosyltransferase [Bosea sp. EC-HK365B]VXB07019.1 Orotate phosphoribosyltransferase [Bosea sp. 29B]